MGAVQLAARRTAGPLAEASRAGVDFADLPYGELGDDRRRGAPVVSWPGHGAR